MDPYIWIPRTVIAVAYPAFSSLQAVLSDSSEAALDWMKYWVVLGVFSLLELMLDPLVDPLPFSYPTYVILKCIFLIWCMVPFDWNGSLIIFEQVEIGMICLKIVKIVSTVLDHIPFIPKAQ